MRPLLPDWERWQFYLMHRNQHRESNTMKKEKNIFQMTEKDKTSEELSDHGVQGQRDTVWILLFLHT